ncbi:MAG: UDP-N-acetylglucosamine diphosphorylase [Opitutales bacterium]
MQALELFDFPASLPFADFFPLDAAPWQWVDSIKEALKGVRWFDLGKHPAVPPGVKVEGQVYLHPSVKLPAFASIKGPTYVGAGTEIRAGAYIRGNVIAGENCVLGNSCEFKNCLLLDGVQAPHFNYVGDSVLGNGAHLGAGVILANLRLDQANVLAKTPDGPVDSGMRKLGALMGDRSEAGCNAVLQPGTVLGKRAIVMSGLPYSGYLEPGTMVAPKTELRYIQLPEPD